MSPRTSTIALLVLVGVLLLTNPLWLLPHEGDTEYTYERSEIAVQNGEITYDGVEAPGFADENSLTAVDCQSVDDEHPRACAFDAYLARNGPVTVAGTQTEVTRPEFVRVENDYYRRIHRGDSTGGNQTATYAVERVTPETVLSEAARDIPDSASLPDDLPLQVRVASSGDTVTSFEDLDEAELGTLYRIDGTYYTVVVTDERHVDHGLGFLRYELPRYTLMLLGVAATVGALYVTRTSE